MKNSQSNLKSPDVKKNYETKTTNEWTWNLHNNSPFERTFPAWIYNLIKSTIKKLRAQLRAQYLIKN